MVSFWIAVLNHIPSYRNARIPCSSQQRLNGFKRPHRWFPPPQQGLDSIQLTREPSTTMPATADASSGKRGPKVLCLGLPRTGTFSVYQALTDLGYCNVHHGMSPDTLEKGTNLAEWRIWSRACDAAFPTLPTYTGKRLSRAEWDGIFGDCDATTDIASLFAEQLITAYPDAKVVLVERDVDRWLDSIDEVLLSLYSPAATFWMTRVEPLLGTIAGPVSRRMWSGWLGLGDPDTTTLDQKRAVLAPRYRAHYARIREMVPEGRLLDFKLEQGWAPLCEFLGQPVPKDKEFPRTNDREAWRQFLRKVWMKGLWMAVTVLGPWVVGAGAAVSGLMWYSRRQ